MQSNDDGKTEWQTLEYPRTDLASPTHQTEWGPEPSAKRNGLQGVDVYVYISCANTKHKHVNK